MRIDLADGRTIEVPAENMKELEEYAENAMHHLHTGVMGHSEDTDPADDILVAVFALRKMIERIDEQDAKMDKIIEDYNELAQNYNQLVTGFNTTVAVNKVLQNEVDRLRALAGEPSLKEAPMDMEAHRAEWDPSYAEVTETPDSSEDVSEDISETPGSDGEKEKEE